MKMVVLLVVFCLASLSIHADEPTAASVEKLFAISKVQASIDAVRSGLEQRMKVTVGEMMKAYAGNPKLQKAGEAVGPIIGRQLAESLKWENLKEGYIKLYQETFTQEEIDAQIAFYETPTGKSVIEKMPVLAVKSSQLVQQQTLPLYQKMQQTIKEEFAKALKEE